MDKFVAVLSNLGSVKARTDDDAVDRLSRRYTTFFLLLFAILVSTKQYVGDPISCWVPAQFTDSHEVYTNKICWVSNTYYLPFAQTKIPKRDEAKKSIGYYQWIPMVLVLQASLFYVPGIFWRILSRRSGINLKAIIDAAATCQETAVIAARERSLQYMVNHVDNYVGVKRTPGQGCWNRIVSQLSRHCIFILGTAYGNYLTYVYLLIKLLYFTNCVGQLFILSVFLGTDFPMFGARVLRDIANGEQQSHTLRNFPRVTLCDFEVRQLGNVHRHTVQCVLPINLFNEKIFLFLWFWFVLVASVTMLSFLQWLLRSVNHRGQAAFVKQELVALGRISRETEGRTYKFTSEYLKQDGVFILRLIMKNAGEVIAAEVLSGLWEIYIREHRLLMENYRANDAGDTENQLQS